MFVVVHSAEFLIQSYMGGAGFMGKKCKRKKNKDCECICHSKKKKRSRKCPRKKLICIHRCVPINQKCDDVTTQTYFCASSDSNIKNPSGTITIINTSNSCAMQVTITKLSNDHEDIDVAPNSSFTAIVANLKSVKILCKSQSNNDIYCTGSMELDIHYTLMF
ncbi:S-Ena type endospore appendage [Peribacillus sp. TH14]|uniref:S-Ena type endospore appendage n=1 Tax=unclassified Peribacillus TaxID=2675266 RepID=UPI00406C64DD